MLLDILEVLRLKAPPKGKCLFLQVCKLALFSVLHVILS